MIPITSHSKLSATDLARVQTTPTYFSLAEPFDDKQWQYEQLLDKPITVIYLTGDPIYGVFNLRGSLVAREDPSGHLLKDLLLQGHFKLAQAKRFFFSGGNGIWFFQYQDKISRLLDFFDWFHWYPQHTMATIREGARFHMPEWTTVDEGTLEDLQDSLAWCIHSGKLQGYRTAVLQAAPDIRYRIDLV